MVMQHKDGGRFFSASRAGKHVLLAVLVMIAAGLFVQVGRSQQATPDATETHEPAGPGEMLAVTGTLGRDSNGIYLVDLANETICVYEYRTSQKSLKLLAARRFTYDVQLDAYNTEPSPLEIKALVEGHRRMDDPAEMPTELTPAMPDQPELIDVDPQTPLVD